MSQRIWRAVLVVSGLGFPLTQLVIRRFGRPGAVVVEVVCGGLLVRDAVLIATGVPGLLRRGPATLLWMEVAAGVAAVLTGLRPLGNADALHRAQQGRPDLRDGAPGGGRDAVRAAHRSIPDIPATRLGAQERRTGGCIR